MKTILTWSGRIALGGVFLYAGALKALDPQLFATDIGHYRLLPYPLVLAAGLYLPWLELLCGGAVLLRRHEKAALLILAGLCAVFSAALASAWVRKLDLTCGCFGEAVATGIPMALARSVLLGTVAIWLLWQSRSFPSPSASPAG